MTDSSFRLSRASAARTHSQLVTPWKPLNSMLLVGSRLQLRYSLGPQAA